MKFGRTEFLILAAVSLFAIAVGNNRAHAELLLVPTNAKARISEKVAPDHMRRRPVLWRPPRPTDLPFRVTNSRVDVRINENIATTTIEQSFLNLSGQQLEVRVMIPLPKGAAINNSALSMNDEMVKGKLYTAQEAHRIYTSIVQQRRDPALLRFVGNDLYEARVFPIPPNQERRLKFRYDHVLKPVGGLYSFRHILSGSQLYQHGLENFTFECVIRSKDPLGPVYSPSHTVAVKRKDAHTAIVKLRDSNLSTDSDFLLYFAPSTEDINLRVLTHRPSADEDGYFMVMARPGDQLDASKILPKEIVFVLDTSGSMAGGKIDQARKALTFCISQLNEKDRFNLVTFSTEVRALSAGKLLVANKANVQKALAAVDTIEATGGTDIDGALREALRNDFSSGNTQAKLVIFLTDGLPSVGITDIGEILKDVRSANNDHKTRIFNFGVGTDVNTHLLDTIATEFAGTSSYVAPKEDLELKVSAFYGKIKNPVMTDVAFDFGSGTRAHSMYPRRIPAMFKGSEVLLMGRFKGTGSGAVVLNGSVTGEARQISTHVDWPSQTRDNDFLPRIWAMRKIGHLIESIRLRGSNQETISEIVKLAQRHGIVTPYTSQLVLEPGMRPGQFMGGVPRGGEGGGWRGRRDRVAAMRNQMGRALEKKKREADGKAFDKEAEESGAALVDSRKEAKDEAAKVAQQVQSESSGGVAVALAETERMLKDATSASAAQPKAPANKPMDANAQAASNMRNRAFSAGKASVGNSKGGRNDAEMMADMIAVAKELTIKHIGTRTFYLRAGVWVDSKYKAKKDVKPTLVETFSEAYFKLLEKHAELGEILALDGNILIVVGDQAYRIAPAKK